MISIIIPVYNVEAYLEKSLNSIINQTFKDLEIILVDDGSMDKSGDLCDEFSKKDERIKVIHQENAGTSAARNRGLEEARGEYLAFLDSDDYIDENYFEVLYRNAMNGKAKISVCSYCNVWENKKNKIKKPKNFEMNTYLCTGREASMKIVKESQLGMITPWGKLFHASLKDKLFFPIGRRYEDEFVLYKAFYESEHVIITNLPLYYYVQRSNSFMNAGYSIRLFDKLIALKEAIQYFDSKDDKELKKFAIVRYLLNIQISWYKVHYFMKENQVYEKYLLEEHAKIIELYQVDYKKIDGFINKVALAVFVISPSLYGIIAGAMLALMKEE